MARSTGHLAPHHNTMGSVWLCLVEMLQPSAALRLVKSSEVWHSVGLEVLDKRDVPKDRDIFSY